jgi:nucleoside-diphosphate-sugar epimerase
MKIFITGIGGFLGKYLADQLLDKHEVYGLYMREEEPHDKRIKASFADLREYTKIGQILNRIQPDIIIHLAARTEVEKSFYEQVTFSEINYCGTVNLIEKARELKNLKLFIFASTMETYGWQPKPYKVFDESTQQHPNAPYAIAKVACEKYLEYAYRTSNFPYVALRQTNTYGRWDNNFFVVEQIITQMLEKDTIELGYKSPMRNFLFVNDLIELYLKIIENPDKVKGEIFCVGPENALTIEDLVKKIANKLNWKGKVLWNRKPKRIGEIYYLNSTNKKVTKALGWKPTTSLDDGLTKTIEMWRNNGK